MSNKKNNSWMYGILFTVLGFIALMVTMAIIASRNTESLVVKDYYKEEIAYQGQIDRMKNTQDLQVRPSVVLDSVAGQVQVSFPDGLRSLKGGSIKFYRPNNPNEDFKLPLILDESGKQVLPTAQLDKGAWRVQLSWESGDKGYYLEKPIFLRR